MQIQKRFDKNFLYSNYSQDHPMQYTVKKKGGKQRALDGWMATEKKQNCRELHKNDNLGLNASISRNIKNIIEHNLMEKWKEEWKCWWKLGVLGEAGDEAE